MKNNPTPSQDSRDVGEMLLKDARSYAIHQNTHSLLLLSSAQEEHSDFTLEL